MTPAIRAYLSITGRSIDVAAIESAAGVSATKIWRAGEPIDGLKQPRSNDGWKFELSIKRGYYIEEKIAELNRIFVDRSVGLKQLCEKNSYDLKVVCVVAMEDETAGLLLSKELISWLHQIGAIFEIDTYTTVLGEPAEASEPASGSETNAT